ncbi:efflux RND transporter periplasmic adaptor subunit [Microvirga subterranea]|uniref:RND family efflux transporter MFP subunit n=1 Tax=Microvirga subterranea TaxID=186651 RepID=A0A370H2Y1_9HYPH|nr:efflux RND transporter periplasmic adaptor subunit [Microvirga subterranea]RDI50513.1 RND family efflux transporter MFP subunit [Microvirga subterranea]
MVKHWIVAAGVLAAILTGCQEPAPPAPDIRPVRTVTVQRSTGGEPVSLTGQIRAQDEVSLAFRLDGRLIERNVNVGDAIKPGQVIGRLDAQIQQNALRQAQASLSAAQGQLTQARNTFSRQQELLNKGFTTRAQFDQAQQALQSAQAQVDSTQAQLRNAQEQVSYTELQADAAGTVTATGAEPGEVVRAGQMIAQVARQGGRDAVFDVPAQLIRTAPSDPVVDIALTDDPTVKTTGRVREVSPQADPATRTFQVKVGLTNPPPAMRLGATVVGRIQLTAPPGVEIPASSLTEANKRPAVWVVDPQSQTVSLRNVDILRQDPASVVVSQGLETGEVVVTAGVQALRPGQKVRLLGGAS